MCCARTPVRAEGVTGRRCHFTGRRLTYRFLHACVEPECAARVFRCFSELVEERVQVAQVGTSSGDPSRRCGGLLHMNASLPFGRPLRISLSAVARFASPSCGVHYQTCLGGLAAGVFTVRRTGDAQVVV